MQKRTSLGTSLRPHWDLFWSSSGPHLGLHLALRDQFGNILRSIFVLLVAPERAGIRNTIEVRESCRKVTICGPAGVTESPAVRFPELRKSCRKLAKVTESCRNAAQVSQKLQRRCRIERQPPRSAACTSGWFSFDPPSSL